MAGKSTPKPKTRYLSHCKSVEEGGGGQAYLKHARCKMLTGNSLRKRKQVGLMNLGLLATVQTLQLLTAWIQDTLSCKLNYIAFKWLLLIRLSKQKQIRITVQCFTTNDLIKQFDYGNCTWFVESFMTASVASRIMSGCRHNVLNWNATVLFFLMCCKIAFFSCASFDRTSLPTSKSLSDGVKGGSL